ncbi:MAG: hypothetical protein K6C99_07700 [Lachnospiraceae bacterium]|nr:hypothetical protein [Lachnospiraceae bacterium]
MYFIVFTGGEKNPLFDTLMADADIPGRSEVTGIIPHIPESRSKLWEFHHKRGLNRNAPAPFKGIWGKYAADAEMKVEAAAAAHPGETLALIFSNLAMVYYEPATLKRWKERYKAKLFLYLVDKHDSVYAADAVNAARKGIFDRVFTFSPEDADSFGFDLFDCYYSTPQTDGDVPVETDAFFWGTDGGRRARAESIYRQLTDAGLKVQMGICYTEITGKELSGITYNEPIPYEEVLRRAKGSRCLIDLTGYYSGGVTLRYFEAVSMGKKLLSDNKQVKNMRLYDSEQIFVPDDVDAIGEDMIAMIRKEMPAAVYNGEFSPVHLLDMCERYE